MNVPGEDQRRAFSGVGWPLDHRWVALFVVLMAGTLLAYSVWGIRSGPEMRADPPIDDALGPVGQIGGTTSAVVVDGPRAYVAVGRRIETVDVSDPSTPRSLGHSDALPEVIHSLDRDGDLLLAAAGTAGLVVYRADEGGHLSKLAQVTSPWTTLGLAVRNRTAYVVDGASGLRIVDLRQPESPVTRGVIDTPGDARAIALSGHHAYVADWGTGVQIIDVEDPDAPHAMGQLDTGGETVDVLVQGDVLLAADRAGEVTVFHVTNPAQPRLLARISVDGSPERLAKDGRWLYIAAGPAGVLLVDTEDPTEPRITDRLSGTTISWDVTARDGLAYVADVGAYVPKMPGIGTGTWESTHIWGVEAQDPGAKGFSGLRIVDREGSRLQERAVHLSPAFVENVEFAGRHMLLADGYAGVVAVELDGSRPRIHGTHVTAGAAHDTLWAAGGSVFVADGSEGVAALKMASDGTLSENWRVDTPGEALGIARHGNRLLVADGESGLVVIDGVDGPRPTRTHTVPLPGYAWDVTVHDGHAWVSARWGGVHVVALDGGADPRLLTSALSGDAVVFQTVFREDVAWIAGGPSGLIALDARSPGSLTEVGRLVLSGTTVGLALDGDTAFVAAGTAGLRVVEIKDPSALREIRAWSLPGVAERVALRGGLAYVATERGGLQVVRVRPAPSRIVLPLLELDREDRP